MEIIKCDFLNPVHKQKVVELLDYYMQDPMGGGHPMPEYTRLHLIEGLAKHPTAFILFAKENEEFIGLITCFVNFSTFKAKPYINIHDVVVLKHLRGKGIGRKLLEAVIKMAEKNDYGKVTLEVRMDNINAQGLYKSLGFEECEPVMHYWERMI